jgi:hypothetical protein
MQIFNQSGSNEWKSASKNGVPRCFAHSQICLNNSSASDRFWDFGDSGGTFQCGFDEFLDERPSEFDWPSSSISLRIPSKFNK